MDRLRQWPLICQFSVCQCSDWYVRKLLLESMLETEKKLCNLTFFKRDCAMMDGQLKFEPNIEIKQKRCDVIKFLFSNLGSHTVTCIFLNDFYSLFPLVWLKGYSFCLLLFSVECHRDAKSHCHSRVYPAEETCGRHMRSCVSLVLEKHKASPSSWQSCQIVDNTSQFLKYFQ